MMIIALHKRIIEVSIKKEIITHLMDKDTINMASKEIIINKTFIRIIITMAEVILT